MAGHSKWSNIKHKKNSNDKKRGKLFSKLVNNIKISLQKKNIDVKCDNKINKAISRALHKNVSKTTIKNVILKNEISLKNKEIYTIKSMYGSIFIIECIKSNNFKVISDLKYFFCQFHGFLINLNSVLKFFHNFDKLILREKCNEENLFYKIFIFYVENFVDNSLIVNSDDVLKIRSIISLKVGVINFIFFKPKIFLKLKISHLKKFYLLKEKLEKKKYITKIFCNIKNLF